MNVIEVKNVSICYKNRYKSIIAVENVSFTVQEGDYLCIVGDNGSGKSSLVKAIVGLSNIICGKINLNVSKDEISYLTQSSSIPLDFPATVKEIVLSGTIKCKNFFPFYRKKDFELAQSAMDFFGITNLKHIRFGELSGGQRQRVLLSRAICKNPKVLILDEPFSALDFGTVTSLYSLLQKLNDKMKTTIVMVTHNQKDVQKYAKHVLELDRTLSFYGTKSQWMLNRKCGD